MIDAQRLLDQFLGTGQARPGGVGSTQGAGSGLPGGLDKILSGALGGSGGRGGGLGGSLGGLGGQIPTALAGGLAGYLLRGKNAKKLGGSAIKLGGLALVAGLGYKAWQNYQASQGGGAGAAGGFGSQGALPRPVPAGEVPSAQGTVFLPPESEADKRARLLLSAMIAAAKADGYIDAGEEQAIFGRIDELQLDPEEKGLLMDEMRRPRSIDDLVAEASAPEIAVEVYLASVLAVDADHPAERAYLAMLAARLGLEDSLVEEIRRTAEEAKTA
ncbi:tellurite resistance TerB family protein [Aureimonas populi]|uniref:Tellurite resistance TerB family protein n=1 Tax=Aureimonas populi TaxID=1701758 RepID=A0ABW5CPC7_9HYPH|nr:tellurite resistance TerB family protein [Aureimonas populi]